LNTKERWNGAEALLFAFLSAVDGDICVKSIAGRRNGPSIRELQLI
jgi:hypothetical protein